MWFHSHNVHNVCNGADKLFWLRVSERTPAHLVMGGRTRVCQAHFITKPWCCSARRCFYLHILRQWAVNGDCLMMEVTIDQIAFIINDIWKC